MISWICDKILKLWGWKVEGEYPRHIKKNIVIAAPHTSNWDFPVGVMHRAATKINVTWVGKASLFKGPLGFFTRFMNGIPVDRTKNNNFVDAVVEAYNQREEMSILIAPEGTRKYVDKLKTGFYYIALGAKIPIVMIQSDWSTKTMRWAEPFYPTGDKEKDFEEIYAFFKPAIGKIPEYTLRYKLNKEVSS